MDATGDAAQGLPAGDLAAGDLPADVQAMIEEMQATGELPDLGPGGLGEIGNGAPTGGFPGGGIAGIGGAQTVSQQVIDLLLQDADDHTWVAATMGATAAAPYQLATDRSVMPIGGFSSSDPAPTLEQFQSRGRCRPDPLVHRRPERWAGRRVRRHGRRSIDLLMGHRQLRRRHRRRGDALRPHLSTPRNLTTDRAPGPEHFVLRNGQVLWAQEISACSQVHGRFFLVSTANVAHGYGTHHPAPRPRAP